VSKRFVLGIVACLSVGSCSMPPTLTGNFVHPDAQGKLEPSIFEDKIPLVNAVKKACLISDFSTNGSDQVLGPGNELKLEDIFLRSLLVHCRISKVQPGSVGANAVVVTFRRGADAEVKFDQSLPYYNLITSIEVSGQRVFQAFQPYGDDSLLRLGDINTPEVALIMSLDGMTYPKNPVTAFERACAATRISTISFGGPFGVLNLKGLEDTVRVAPIETKDVCAKTGKFGKCPADLPKCEYINDEPVSCHPEVDPNDPNGGFVMSPSAYFSAGSSYTLEEGTFVDPKGNGGRPFIALPFEANKPEGGQITWLVSAAGNSTYNPTRDPNCSEPSERKLVQSVRNSTIAPWLEQDYRQTMHCFDRSKPRLYASGFLERAACSPGRHMPYPNYSKGGYCEMSVRFDTIVHGNRVFSISKASIGGGGIGMTEQVIECHSSIAVAE
jgi:hypothetical protein